MVCPIAARRPAGYFDPSSTCTGLQGYADHWLRVVEGCLESRFDCTLIEPFTRALHSRSPLPEQAAIVRFLDHADRRIRRYIRAKQKLIKLLEEQKQAIIHRAVTRGLDPNVRLKPSGVEWLGDVPEHWEVSRVKTEFCLSRIVGVIPLSSTERGAMVNSDVRLLRGLRCDRQGG